MVSDQSVGSVYWEETWLSNMCSKILCLIGEKYAYLEKYRTDNLTVPISPVLLPSQ